MYYTLVGQPDLKSSSFLTWVRCSGERHVGKVWHFVNHRWGAILYQGNSREATMVLGKKIDEMRFDEQDAKEYKDEIV